MAFKKLNDFKNQKYGGKFILQNNGDTADVIFLYRNQDDVLIVDCHYIKTPEYSGYVHCTGRGCPACEKGIRVQSKLFIPLYNIDANEVQFWDRSSRFFSQFDRDVFNRYPESSTFVFGITRDGESNDINTRYLIHGKARNTFKPYDQILSEQNVKFPEYYDHICKDVDTTTLSRWLSTSSASSSTTYGSASSMPEYVPTPRVRVSSTPVDLPDLPDADAEDDLGEVDFGD